ncbi:hypothetical protein [Nocardia amikacinitolerans]|uniref:hypothetical protein n=1 Tax=Nocardia amikacinitolerans TaxID=756689 RepID=UPI0012EEA7CE|nr:hypothetical protein [Nocardia amikacinitolerans]
MVTIAFDSNKTIHFHNMAHGSIGMSMDMWSSTVTEYRTELCDSCAATSAIWSALPWKSTLKAPDSM